MKNQIFLCIFAIMVWGVTVLTPLASQAGDDIHLSKGQTVW